MLWTVQFLKVFSEICSLQKFLQRKTISKIIWVAGTMSGVQWMFSHWCTVKSITCATNRFTGVVLGSQNGTVGCWKGFGVILLAVIPTLHAVPFCTTIVLVLKTGFWCFLLMDCINI